MQQNPKIDLTQTLLVYFDAFGESSLNIMIYCFTKTVKWAEWLEAQQEVYLKIIEIVHKNGADFADTTQLLYLDNNEGALKVEVKQPEMPAAPLPEADAVASKIDSTPAAMPKS